MIRQLVLRPFGALLIIVCIASTAAAVVEPRALPKIALETRLLHSANIFVKDDRIPITPNPKHFFYLSPIGELVNNQPISLGNEHGYSQFTGFMVSPCHVLTVYHGVFGDSDNPNNVDFSDTLYLGFDEHGKARFRAKAIPVVWGSGVGDAQDWALLQIEPCRGAASSIGWMSLGTTLGKRWGTHGLTVALAGFMGDKPWGQLYLDPVCHLYQAPDGPSFFHDCADFNGASGSPIFIMNPGGLPEVVGMEMGSVWNVDGVTKRYSPSLANTANSIDVMRAQQPDFQREINRGLQFFASKVPGAHNPQLDMLKAENSSP